MNDSAPQKHVALYSVLVDGEEIPQEISTRIREVRVLNYLRLPDVCTFTAGFQKGQDGRPEPVDSHPFEIGRELEVRLGAREALSATSLFKGEIVTLEPRFAAGGVELLVRGFDRSHELMRTRRVRTFQNQTATDIVGKIAREAGLRFESDPSGEPHEFVQQDNETDWDFIWRLAERAGFEFLIEDQIARFRRPTSDGAIELEWPKTLRTFHPRVTAVQQVQEVTLLAQDPKTKEAIDVSVSSPEQIAQIGLDRETVAAAFDGAKAHIATEPVKSQAEGTAVAQALLDRLANAYIAAEGVTDGNPDIRAGATVSVSGVGDKFSGTYRVARAVHVLRGAGTYETTFANSPAHTVLGTVGTERATGRGSRQPSFGSQLALGVVTNNKDPEDMGRVRVRYPALGSDAEGTWARIATMSAGNERGVLMMPVVGEEVLIAFEHDDTTRPYVLGSLFNGKDLPGDDLLQGSDGTFALRSDKRIHVESKEDHTVKSGGKLTVDVTQDVTIKGHAQITLDASSTLTLTCGDTQIELSSSGVQISGSMITMG
jgi:phage protein D